MAANIIRKFSNQMPVWFLKLAGNFWFPFFGAGIKIAEVSKDYHYMKVILKRRWYNANYVGTQFGGSMYAMTDPFYMIMLIQILGPDYIVWDKAAQIEFKKPGKTNLTAEFRLNFEQIQNIKKNTENGQKHIFDLPVEIYDNDKVVVATVQKTLYVRKKKMN